MPESEYSQENLAAIRTHLNDLEQMVRFNTASNPHNKDAVKALFASRPGLAEVYLALEGEPKTQPELARAVGVNQSTISRSMKVLLDAGLATAIPAAGTRRNTTYMRSGVETLIGVARLARSQVATAPKPSEEKISASTGALDGVSSTQQTPPPLAESEVAAALGKRETPAPSRPSLAKSESPQLDVGEGRTEI